MLGNVLWKPATRQTFLKDFPYIHPGIYYIKKKNRLVGSVCGYKPSVSQKLYPHPSLHPVGGLDFIIFFFYSSGFQISFLPQVFCGSAIALSLTYRNLQWLIWPLPLKETRIQALELVHPVFPWTSQLWYRLPSPMRSWTFCTVAVASPGFPAVLQCP